MLNLRTSRRGLLAGMALAMLPRAAGAAAPVNLSISSRVLDVKGKAAKVYGITDGQGRHGINMLLQPRFAANLTNTLADETLVHWHGLTPPAALDGTPMLSGPTLKPGESRLFEFPNREAGTHWMHSHVGLQEQLLLAAPLIIRETAAPLFDEQEHVVMLHDFSFRDPQEILAELQGGGGGHAAHAGHGTGPATGAASGTASGHDGHGTMPAMPAMLPAMLNDIIYDAMLANDRTLDDPEVVPVEKAGRIRLRIINACAASNLWVDLGPLSGELIAVDGKTIHALKGQRFPLAVAQRADIRIQLPQGAGTWPILFKSEGATLQSGIILRSADAPVAMISDQGDAQPALDLSLESRLTSVAERPDIAVSRTDMIMLTGGGADYVWGLNGKSAMHDTIMTVREGERYEVMFHNMTSMAHPMHLHGHYFKVVGIGGSRINGAIRDTILVPVGETVTIQFDADNPGTWAFHCHHLYHMNAGMMGALAYAEAA
jgi:FtsP/CotA-like multicopper oxidase with cupredoxin domain